jgi:phosphoserine phosphatase
MPPLTIYVDLDGSLVQTDTLVENIKVLLSRRPFTALLLPLWLCKGKAYFKYSIARAAAIDVKTLPYHGGLLEYLKERKQQGCRLILATAASEIIAAKVMAHLGIFDGFMASTATHNLSGHKKLAKIQQADAAFAYVGNASVDLPIWKAATEAIVINASSGLVRLAQRNGNVVKVF